MRSGNHIVDIHEALEAQRENSKTTCPKCLELGQLYLDIEELKQYLYEECVTARKGLTIYHEWKKNGNYVVCSKCEGEEFLYDQF